MEDALIKLVVVFKKKLKYFKFAAFIVGMRLGSEDLSFCYFLTVVCVRWYAGGD